MTDAIRPFGKPIHVPRPGVEQGEKTVTRKSVREKDSPPLRISLDEAASIATSLATRIIENPDTAFRSHRITAASLTLLD